MLFWKRKKKDEQTTAAPPKCVGVARGQWGEDVAAAYLTGQGWRILERNARPCRRDRWCLWRSRRIGGIRPGRIGFGPWIAGRSATFSARARTG